MMSKLQFNQGEKKKKDKLNNALEIRGTLEAMDFVEKGLQKLCGGN